MSPLARILYRGIAGELRFNPGALEFKFTSRSKLVGRPDLRFARVTMTTGLSNLKLSGVALKYAKEILGVRYDWEKGSIRLTSEKYDKVSLNRRHCVEMLHLVCLKAEEMAAEFGDFEQTAPDAKRLGWQRQRKRR